MRKAVVLFSERAIVKFLKFWGPWCTDARWVTEWTMDKKEQFLATFRDLAGVNGQILTPSFTYYLGSPVCSRRLIQVINLKLYYVYLWQFQTTTPSSYRMVPHYDFPDQVIKDYLKAYIVHLTTAPRLACFFNSPRNWTASLRREMRSKL